MKNKIKGRIARSLQIHSPRRSIYGVFDLSDVVMPISDAAIAIVKESLKYKNYENKTKQ